MKKLTMLLTVAMVAVMASVMLVGCGNNETPTNGTTTRALATADVTFRTTNSNEPGGTITNLTGPQVSWAANGEVTLIIPTDAQAIFVDLGAFAHAAGFLTSGNSVMSFSRQVGRGGTDGAMATAITDGMAIETVIYGTVRHWRAVGTTGTGNVDFRAITARAGGTGNRPATFVYRHEEDLAAANPVRIRTQLNPIAADNTMGNPALFTGATAAAPMVYVFSFTGANGNVYTMTVNVRVATTD